MGFAREIRRHVDLIDYCSARDQALPGRVREAAEDALLWCCDDAIRRRDDPVVVSTLELAKLVGGAAIAPIAARNERTDLYFSSLINGMLVEGDFAAAFGAFIAAAHAGRLRGSQALAAFAMGCEVQMRFASALRAQWERGWDPAGVAGVLASAVTAALLLDVEAIHVESALGIASSMTLGQREAAGTTSAAVIGAKAAANGVLSAMLAMRDFTGPRLETPRGYSAVFHLDSGPVLTGLGVRWTFVEHVRSSRERDRVSSPLRRAVRGLASATDAAAMLEAITA